MGLLMAKLPFFFRAKIKIDESFFRSQRELAFSTHDLAPQKCENVFSRKELDLLRAMAAKSSNRDIRPGSTNIYVDWSYLSSILVPKIKKWIPAGGQLTGGFNATTIAFPPHTDSPTDPHSASVIQFIVPVDTWGKGSDCSVVFFNQKYYGPHRSPIFQLPERDLLKWHRSRGKYIVNYDLSSSIDDNLLNGPLSSFNPLLLTGLSVADVITYKPGDLVVFGGSRVHCSGSLQYHGLFAKLLLLIRVVLPIT